MLIKESESRTQQMIFIISFYSHRYHMKVIQIRRSIYQMIQIQILLSLSPTIVQTIKSATDDS